MAEKAAPEAVSAAVRRKFRRVIPLPAEWQEQSEVQDWVFGGSGALLGCMKAPFGADRIDVQGFLYKNSMALPYFALCLVLQEICPRLSKFYMDTLYSGEDLWTRKRLTKILHN